MVVKDFGKISPKYPFCGVFTAPPPLLGGVVRGPGAPEFEQEETEPTEWNLGAPRCARVSRPRTNLDRRSPGATFCGGSWRPAVGVHGGVGDPRRARWRYPDRAVRGSPDPAPNWTAGLPVRRLTLVRGDLRSAVTAGSETRAERWSAVPAGSETRAERWRPAASAGDPRRALLLTGSVGGVPEVLVAYISSVMP